MSVSIGVAFFLLAGTLGMSFEDVWTALDLEEGDTPVELALRFGHAEVADLLRKARQGGGEASGEPATAGSVRA